MTKGMKKGLYTSFSISANGWALLCQLSHIANISFAILISLVICSPE